jgi:hypothetical protein
MATLNFSHAEPITPSNTVPAPANGGILVGTTGDISITTRVPEVGFAPVSGTPRWTETTQILTAVTAGTILPISVHRVNATGTTATGVVALR